MKHISTLIDQETHKKMVNEALDKSISLQELQRQIINQHYESQECCLNPDCGANTDQKS